MYGLVLWGACMVEQLRTTRHNTFLCIRQVQLVNSAGVGENCVTSWKRYCKVCVFGVGHRRERRMALSSKPSAAVFEVSLVIPST